jgi:hypothetical protein
VFGDLRFGGCVHRSRDGLNDDIWNSCLNELACIKMMADGCSTWVFLWVAETEIDLVLTIDDVLDAEIDFVGVEVLDSCSEVFLIF